MDVTVRIWSSFAMEQIPGSFGTILGFSLRLGQTVSSGAALMIMSRGVDFYDYTAFWIGNGPGLGLLLRVRNRPGLGCSSPGFGLALIPIGSTKAWPDLGLNGTKK
ncbi:hypothetical protein AMTR_s00059p00177330 [Amborella trichopoda]|uniref:Uncharacterized protein n=1 Tax=Amborella trichopoda TaxID=13333 RepID=U5CWE1_AMBTC|nr:hypothetical protein AMTR_s00059p00177330 [Amborella trichopoda]